MEIILEIQADWGCRADLEASYFERREHSNHIESWLCEWNLCFYSINKWGQIKIYEIAQNLHRMAMRIKIFKWLNNSSIIISISHRVIQKCRKNFQINWIKTRQLLNNRESIRYRHWQFIIKNKQRSNNELKAIINFNQN